MTGVSHKEAKQQQNTTSKSQSSLSQPQDEKTILISEINKNIALIEKAIASKETRFITRCMWQTPPIRRKMRDPSFSKEAILSSLIKKYCPPETPLRSYITSVPSQSATEMEVDSPVKSPVAIPKNKVDPEVPVYLHLLLCMHLIDTIPGSPALVGKHHKDKDEEMSSVDDISEKMNCKQNALLCAKQLTQECKRLDTVADPIVAKCWFCYSKAAELCHKLSSIRSELLAAYRTASLRCMDETKATVLNLLLRNYLEYNLYDQADKLISKISNPTDQTITSNQYARFLYYQGKIKTIQLEYTEAFKDLQMALRKVPQKNLSGFQLAVTKLLCIVQLLMGEIPERSMFNQKGLRTGLRPYLALTQAVRVGDLNEFKEVVEAHSASFKKDRTVSLILRLRHNVIKTGLRKICTSYSRISLAEISKKLRLESVQDCEFIVAKAIRDGVIDATIDHEGGFVKSKENLDVYSTQEPRTAFHRRITFCLNIHNEAVKAMRFAPDAHKPKPLQQAKDSVEDLDHEEDNILDTL